MSEEQQGGPAPEPEATAPDQPVAQDAVETPQSDVPAADPIPATGKDAAAKPTGPLLPILWGKNELNLKAYRLDPARYAPILIYPNPLNPSRYVVLNSGHTFKEADLKGTNALLYPRLGDWAVIKPTPADKDPAAYEVVAAGLFDENWQFPKKK